MPPIRVKHTDTVEAAWDSGKNVANLKSGENAAYYRQMFAWQDPQADDTTKGAYKFPHHMVDVQGNIGAANVKGCQSGCGVLNGAMGGADIPGADRQGVYDHLVAHLKDAGMAESDLPMLSGRQAIPEMETRSIPQEVRAQAGADGTPHIVGLAPVFGQLSDDLGGFREIIEPTALDGVLEHADVRGQFNHDLILGRSKNKTLSLTLTPDGLQYDIIINPEDPAAMGAYARVKRGDVSGSSFMFAVAPDGEQWVQSAAGVVRHVMQISEFLDVGPVTFPAYPQTTAQVRSIVEKFQQVRGLEPAAAEAQLQAFLRIRHAHLLRRLDIAEKLLQVYKE